MPTIYLAYGSNMGDRLKNIYAAVDLLKKAGVKVTKVSKPIETKPLGGVPQANFLNGVLAAETELNPLILLKSIKKIETELGRVKFLKNGPRPIDLDILLFGNRRINNKFLRIPHPEIKKRKFVSFPLSEIAPEIDLRRI